MLLNQDLVRSILKDDAFASSHHANHGENFLGSGILYYAFPYMMKARYCVCLGSGSGFVPKLIRQGQLDSGIDDPLTVLVDANLPEAGWGVPDYHAGDTHFTKNWQVKIVEKTTIEAASMFEEDSIDYLHIDADHSYEAVTYDLMTYMHFMKHKGIVTLHDSVVRDVGVFQLVQDVRDANKHDIINLSIGTGLAIFRKERV